MLLGRLLRLFKRTPEVPDWVESKPDDDLESPEAPRHGLAKSYVVPENLDELSIDELMAVCHEFGVRRVETGIEGMTRWVEFDGERRTGAYVDVILRDFIRERSTP